MEVKRARFLLAGATGITACFAFLGCGLILGLDQFKETTDGSMSVDGMSNCDVDTTKECIPQSCLGPSSGQTQLLNACTPADCISFDDNARVKGPRLPDGGLPPISPLVTDGSTGTPPGDASAPVMCNAINAHPVVYVAGTAKPYIQALAKSLFADPSNPITIVWRGMSSCFAWEELLMNEPIDKETGAATGSYWDTSGNELFCQFKPSGNDAGAAPVPDIIVSDVFADTCTPLPNGLPTNINDFFGPVQTMVWVVPKTSSEKAISAVGAYYVYGFGAAGMVAPWTDNNTIYRLADESGTQLILGKGIGVPADQWRGNNLGSSGTLTKMIPTSSPNSIGPLAYTNITDSVRPTMEILAYKHYGQDKCAYFPDSTDQAKDKKNVRDGHYAMWGPIHFATRVNNGVPINPNAAKAINMWVGVTPPPQGLDLVQIAAINNLVPTCAMNVKRRTEMGNLEPVVPDNGCGCYFEKAAGAPTSAGCKACMKDQDCTDPAKPRCITSYGFCEAR